eukprot:11175129-Lingulodinium_polyedra.AAC.1
MGTRGGPRTPAQHRDGRTGQYGPLGHRLRPHRGGGRGPNVRGRPGGVYTRTAAYAQDAVLPVSRRARGGPVRLHA